MYISMELLGSIRNLTVKFPTPGGKSCVKTPDKSPVQPSRGRPRVDRCIMNDQSRAAACDVTYDLKSISFCMAKGWSTRASCDAFFHAEVTSVQLLYGSDPSLL